jgi:hypothetical protein
MDSSVSLKDQIWFLRVCRHISNAVYKHRTERSVISQSGKTSVTLASRKRLSSQQIDIAALIRDAKGYLQFLDLKSIREVSIDNHATICTIGLLNDTDDDAELMVLMVGRYLNLCHTDWNRGIDLNISLG